MKVCLQNQPFLSFEGFGHKGYEYDTSARVDILAAAAGVVSRKRKKTKREEPRRRGRKRKKRKKEEK